MKIKWLIFAVLVAFFVMLFNSGTVAVSTREVDDVRKKAVLDNSDLKIIDDFLAQAIQELVQTRDFTSIAKIRTVILSRQSTQGQYAQQFSESARRHIAAGFLQAQELRRPERTTAVMINLLILMDGLQDLGLADQAMAMLKNENMVIRYWAVHCLTNTDIITQLNAATNSNRASAIAAQLKGIVDNSTPEIVALIAQFAAGVDIPEAEQLLIQIADLRIKQYADWTVKYELYDSALLKYLSSKIPLSSESPVGLLPTTTDTKPEIARRFAQLYSYAIQRYPEKPFGFGIGRDRRQVSRPTSGKSTTDYKKGPRAAKRTGRYGRARQITRHRNNPRPTTCYSEIRLRLDRQQQKHRTTAFARPTHQTTKIIIHY